MNLSFKSGTKYDVLCLGVCAVDEIFYLDQYPAEDSKGSCRQRLTECGGVAGNIVWALARMGAHCQIITKLGNDSAGNKILRSFGEVDVNIDEVVIDPAGRTPITAIIVSEQTGSRTCVHDRTGISPIEATDINANALNDVRLFVSDCRYLGATAHCMSAARKADVRIVLSIERADQSLLELCEQADVIVVSDSFFDSCKRIETAAAEFAKAWNVPNLVVTTGESGCLVFERSKASCIDGEHCQLVDSIGAGDAFVSGLCLALLRGCPLELACKIGNSIAHCCCEAHGARGGIPHRDVIETIVKMAEK